MLTIGEELKREIEKYGSLLTESNGLLLAAERGALTAEHVHAYVSGILFQIRGTLRILRRAQERAASLGDQALAAHYRHKLGEESGHDRWAEQDLRGLSPSAAERTVHESEAIARLLTYLDDVVQGDPSLYLSYILFAEYLTVLVGPRWLEAVESKCGVPKSMLSVIGNHVELDREHVAEGVREIDTLVQSPDKRGAMLDVLRRSISYYEQFWTEIVSMPTKAA
jgi:hypothetical protein